MNTTDCDGMISKQCNINPKKIQLIKCVQFLFSPIQSKIVINMVIFKYIFLIDTLVYGFGVFVTWLKVFTLFLGFRMLIRIDFCTFQYEVIFRPIAAVK